MSNLNVESVVDWIASLTGSDLKIESNKKKRKTITNTL